MIPSELIDIIETLGFNCEVSKYKLTINRVELLNCKKTYNYYDLSKSFKTNDVFATFCTYDYRMHFKQQIKSFLIAENRERMIKNILDS